MVFEESTDRVSHPVNNCDGVNFSVRPIFTENAVVFLSPVISDRDVEHCGCLRNHHPPRARALPPNLPLASGPAKKMTLARSQARPTPRSREAVAEMAGSRRLPEGGRRRRRRPTRSPRGTAPSCSAGDACARRSACWRRRKAGGRSWRLDRRGRPEDTGREEPKKP